MRYCNYSLLQYQATPIIINLNITGKMEKLFFCTLSRRLLIALFTVSSLCFLGSCTNDDEPEVVINYYLSIQTRTRIYRRGGLPPDPKEDMIGKLTTKMRARIRETYPNPDLEGNDAAVIVACDEIYRQYLETGLRERVECVATLYRARMSNSIVKQSTPIKNYYF